MGENNQNTVNSQRLVFEFMASHILHWQIIISEQAELAHVPGTLRTNKNAIYLQGRVVCGTFIIFPAHECICSICTIVNTKIGFVRFYEGNIGIRAKFHTYLGWRLETTYLGKELRLLVPTLTIHFYKLPCKIAQRPWNAPPGAAAFLDGRHVVFTILLLIYLSPYKP